MSTILAHKIALDPSPTQRVALAKAAGCARVAYNWGLAEWTRQYDAHKTDPSLPKPKGATLRKQWNSVKHELFPWMSESPKDANIEALFDLEKAFKSFFEKRTKYPKFHSKRKNAPSFGVSNDKFRFDGKKVRLPVIGWVKTREFLRFSGKILSGRVTYQRGRWHLSVQVELSEYMRSTAPAATIVGIDLGVLTLATLSDGTVIENPRALRSAQKRLHRTELSVARKRRTADKKLGERKKGERRETSKRLNAAYQKLSRVHGDVAAVRADVIHKVTTKIAETFQMVVVEDLAVKNMTRSAKGRGRASKAGLNRSILDAGFGEFRRQLAYKLPLHGGTLIVADRFFASSKTCSGCGTVKKDLSLKDRTFTCGACSLSVNRDLNAACNLRTFGLKGTYARGHRGRPTGDSSPAATVVETRTKTEALTSAHV